MNRYRQLLNMYEKINKMQFALLFQMEDRKAIHPGQLHFLCFLSENDGISQTDMAKLLCIKAPTLNVMAKRLARSGLVRTERDVNDRRLTRLFITEEGTHCAKQAFAYVEQLETRFFAGFTDEDLDGLEYYFQKIIKNLEKEQEEHHA